MLQLGLFKKSMPTTSITKPPALTPPVRREFDYSGHTAKTFCIGEAVRCINSIATKDQEAAKSLIATAFKRRANDADAFGKFLSQLPDNSINSSQLVALVETYKTHLPSAETNPFYKNFTEQHQFPQELLKSAASSNQKENYLCTMLARACCLAKFCTEASTPETTKLLSVVPKTIIFGIDQETFDNLLDKPSELSEVRQRAISVSEHLSKISKRKLLTEERLILTARSCSDTTKLDSKQFCSLVAAICTENERPSDLSCAALNMLAWLSIRYQNQVKNCLVPRSEVNQDSSPTQNVLDNFFDALKPEKQARSSKRNKN